MLLFVDLQTFACERGEFRAVFRRVEASARGKGRMANAAMLEVCAARD